MPRIEFRQPCIWCSPQLDTRLLHGLTAAKSTPILDIRILMPYHESSLIPAFHAALVLDGFITICSAAPQPAARHLHFRGKPPLVFLHDNAACPQSGHSLCFTPGSSLFAACGTPQPRPFRAVLSGLPRGEREGMMVLPAVAGQARV